MTDPIGMNWNNEERAKAKELRRRIRIARAEAAMHLALKDLNRALTRAAKCEQRVIELRQGAQE